LLAQVVAARPNSGQALHLLGQARLKLGRFAEAREPLERAAKFLPKEVAAQVNYAGCLTVLGDHEASLWAFDRAAKLKPDDPVIATTGPRARGIGPRSRKPNAPMTTRSRSIIA
jgi:cytochrome c-type biogenesis protein CcmH/NrfG